MASRTAVILGLVAVGFFNYECYQHRWFAHPTVAYGCWVLAAVYAILTSHKRWI